MFTNIMRYLKALQIFLNAHYKLRKQTIRYSPKSLSNEFNNREKENIINNNSNKKL